MLSKLYKLVLDAVFPLQCVGCGAEGTLLCAACGAGITADTAHVVNNPTENLSKIYIATSFENELIQKIVHQFKYAGVTQYAEALASLMLHATHGINFDQYTLVPIPLHRKRQITRGYNQSLLLAKQLAAQWHVPVDSGLRRITNNPSQTKLSREERFRNVEKIYKYAGDAAPKHIVLIDDITTTFATLDSAAAELKRKGAKEVIGVVVAKNDV